MESKLLADLHILVVEDDYFLAMVLSEALKCAGAQVLGPVSSVAEAQEIIVSVGKVDAAVLDVNLGSEMVYPVADTLTNLCVPFLLTTGYDVLSLDDRYRNNERCEKPFDPDEAITKLLKAVGRSTTEPDILYF